MECSSRVFRGDALSIKYNQEMMILDGPERSMDQLQRHVVAARFKVVLRLRVT